MADFDQAVQKTLINEGGYQNNPKDKGNWYLGTNYGTNHGITAQDVANYFPDLIGDVNCVRNLTTPQAVFIYKAGYWKDLYSQITDQEVADKLFDMGVLFGVGTAVKLLQISMAGGINVVSDGVFGPNTLAATNEHGNVENYRVVLLNHCMDVINRNPDDVEFLSDWTKRIQG